MFQGGFVSWFLFAGFFPILIYHLGFLLYPINNWDVTRQLSRQVIRAGDSVSISINIERKVPFPIYYCVFEEVLPISLNKVENGQQKYFYMEQPNKLMVQRKVKKAVFPWFKRNIQLDYSIAHVPRGQHTLKEIRVKTGDIFGFVKKEHVFPVEDGLIANPGQLAVRMNNQISNFEQGTVASATNRVTNTNVAAGVREYEPGDRFSWIDWKQTARKNTVMTKEFEQEKSTNILIVLDSCHYPALNPLAYEASIELTLALMETIQKKDTEVGLLTIGGEEEKAYFPMHQDSAAKSMIVNHLSQLEAQGKRSFSLQLKEQMMQMGSGEMVFVITTQMDETFKQTIEQLNKRMNRMVVLFIQSSLFITEIQQKIIGQFRIQGIGVQMITEEQLVKKPIEVNVQ